MSMQPSETEFQDVEIAAIDLTQSQPPGKKILELSAMEIATASHPPSGGVAFLLDRQPPDGWQECFQSAEAALGYQEPFTAKLHGNTLEVEYDPERFEERVTGLKVAVANANTEYRQILRERAEHRRAAAEAEAEYRRTIADAAERLGIETVGE